MNERQKLRVFAGVALALPFCASLPALADDALPSLKTPLQTHYLATCASVGFGFFQIPGSQTCLKINMGVQFETKLDLVQNDITVQTLRLPTAAFPLGSVPIIEYLKQNLSQTANHYVPRETWQFGVTTVTPTDYGPLIAYGNFRNFPQLTLANDRLNLNPSDSMLIDQAWMSFAGFTAGMHRSYFDFTQPGYGYIGGYSSLVNLNMLAYSHVFGDLVSATISLEDNASRVQQDGVLSGMGGQTQPDIVGQLRVAPSWATFQVAGALHKMTDGTANICCNATVHSKEGFALMSGLELRTKWSDIFGAKAGNSYGRLMISGAFAQGAMSYLGIPYFATDYVSEQDGTIRPSNGYSALISYEHLWNPFVKTTLTLSAYGARTHTQPTMITAYTPLQGQSFPAGLFNFDYRVHGFAAQLGSAYTPVSNFVIGAEGNYTLDHVKANYAGVAGQPATVGIWSGSVYVQRNF